MAGHEVDSQFPSFEQQFERRELVNCSGIEIPVVDILPQIQRGLPVFFGPRWMGKIAEYRTIVQALYASGRRVISAELEGSEGIKATQIGDIMGKKDITGADAIAHSVGALSLLNEALEKQGLFRKIVLINAPLIGKEPDRNLISRYIDLMKKGQEKVVDQVRRDGGRKKFFDMASEITGFNPWEKMKRIVANGGEMLSISALSDALFPSEGVLEQAMQNGFEVGKSVIFRQGQHLEINPFMSDIFDFLGVRTS